MSHALPALPYALDALAPHISPETLDYHHGKHHRTYVDKLNELIKGTRFERLSLIETVRQATGAMFINAAQAWNHAFYWQCLMPHAPGRPGSAVTKALSASFGSVDAFKEKFTQTALTTFGSGWIWLTRSHDGTLSIVSAANADTPVKGSDVPLLTCDVWEHAYYIDYRNRRADYLNAFWQVVNWDLVADSLDRQSQPAHV